MVNMQAKQDEKLEYRLERVMYHRLCVFLKKHLVSHDRTWHVVIPIFIAYTFMHCVHIGGEGERVAKDPKEEVVGEEAVVGTGQEGGGGEGES